MAKNINHLQHVKSSVVENGMPKLPAPSVLVEGELAVNYATDKETISLKNSSGIVVTFSSDNYYSDKKLGSGFTGENSAVTVTQAINDNERVVAAALTDLDSRKLDASAYTPTDLSDYATKQWVDEERLGSGFTGENSGRTVTQVIEDDELAISAALNDLNDRKLDMSAYTPTDLSNYYDKDEIDDFLYDFGETLNGKVSSITINNSTKASSNGNVNLGTVISSMTVNGSAVTVTNGAAVLTGLATTSELLKYADKAEYNSSDKKIYFKNGDTTLSSMTIDATDFIKDGMVNEVKIGEPTSGESSGVTCLIVTFNTDAGKEDIEIPLSEIFDSSLYYTKPEIDNVLGSGFTVSAVTSSVTDVFRENELIVASALNDLDGRKLDASAYTPTDLSGYYTRQEVNTMLGNDFIDFSGESFSSVTDIIRADETVTAAALNDLNERKLDASAYTPSEFTDLLDEKLGYWFSGDSLSSVTDVIRENEIIVSSALNDINGRKLDASAYTPTDLSGYYTKQEIDEDKLGSGFTGDNSGTTVTDAFNTVERVVAAALTDLDDRKLDASAYTETDLSDYYNKEAIDDKLGEWFSGSSSVTQVLREDELAISSALNDLNDRKLDASAYTEPDLSSYATKQWVKDDVLGSGFTGNNSGRTITEVIEDNELITSAALNDLNERLVDVEENQLTPSSFKTINNESIIGSGNIVIEGGSGGGGDANAISGVSVNGTPASVSNKVANITSVPASIVTQDATHRFVSDTEKTSWNNVTAKTDTTAFTQHTGDTTAHVTSAEKSTWNGKQNALSCGELKGTMNRSDVSGSGNITVRNTSGEFPTVISEGTYKVVTYMSSTTQSYGLNVTFGGNAYSLTTSNGVIEDEREVAITSNKNWSATISGSVASGTILIVKLYLISSNVSVLGLVAVSNDYDDLYNKPTIPTSLSDINSAHTHSEYALNTAFTAHTASTTAHVTSTEKSTWNGKQDAISDLASIRTSAATQSDWNATSGVAMIKNKPTIPTSLSDLNSAHTHSEYATTGTVNTLNDTVTAHTANTEIHVTAANKTSWDNAVTSAHSHSNKSVLDNLTQTVIDNNHTHDNKTALDSITTAKTASWDTVTAKTDNSAFTAHTASTDVHVTTAEKSTWNGKQDAITDLASIRTSAATQSDWNATSGVAMIKNKPTIPTSLSQLTSAHTHAISEVTNLQTTLDAKVSGVTINNGGKVTPTDGVANLTINASTVGALPTGTTLDDVADGTTRKLSNYSLTSHTHDEYATTGAVNTLNNTVTAHTANTTAHVTTANKTQWNNAISGVSFNGATATVNNHVAAITATIPAAPGTLTTTATTAQATATNQSLSGNIALHKVSKTGSYNDLNDKPTIPAAANNATITLQFGNSSSAFTVNASSNLTINLATLIGIPAPTASDNGKILGVVNGQFAWVTPTTIYTGSDTPSSSQGNNGDIYLQTS